MNAPDPVLREQLQTLLGPRFVLGDEVGSGGFARVFQAFDTSLHSKIAVKVLRPELFQGSGAEERFLREARILAELRHPHIVPILDVFQGNGLLAYLMPLVQGSTLAERLARTGALPLDEAVRILSEIGDALDFVHRRGILHRDLKPANILLSEGHALLSDFGIARSVDGPNAAGITETGYVVGSPGYLSPEQATASSRVDARSDLYSLAVIGYEMIAGRKPFVGDSPDSVLRQQLLAEPTPLTVHRASVPPALDAAIKRGLAPNAADRFATATDFAAACRAALDLRTSTPTPPAPPSPTPVPPSGRLNRRRIALFAGFGLLAVAAAALWVTKFSRLATKPEPLPPGTRAWYVVAQVATRPDDPHLAAATRALLVSTLAQSPTLGALTDPEIAGTLRSAGKPESSIVTPTLARELAIRANARGVLETSVDRTDEGSVLLMRAVDVERDSTLALLRQRLSSKSNLLAVAEKMALELRRMLERNPAPIATLKRGGVISARAVITADFQAWKLVLLAGKQAEAGRDREAVAIYREALALDSTFAWAWNGIGVCYANLAYRDSAAYAFRKALLYPDKFPPNLPWGIESSLLSQLGDYEGNFRLLDRVIQSNPRPGLGWNNHGTALAVLGRNEEALASYHRAEESLPSGDQTIYPNRILSLIALGRTEEASALSAKMKSPSLKAMTDAWVALARSESFQIETTSRALLERTDIDPPSRGLAGVALASHLANRGQLASARQQLDNALIEAKRNQESHNVEILQWAQATLDLAYGRQTTRSQPLITRGTTLESRITEGIQLLVAGKPREARAAARQLERTYANQPLVYERAPELIDAWAASLEGRPQEVIRLAAPLANARVGGIYFPIRKPVAIWLVANAYETLGRPDSAATYYALALSTRDMDPDAIACAALLRSPARQRLALAELLAGRTQEGRAQGEQFLRAFDTPDADVRALVDQMQSALTLSAPSPETNRP